MIPAWIVSVGQDTRMDSMFGLPVREIARLRWGGCQRALAGLPADPGRSPHSRLQPAFVFSTCFQSSSFISCALSRILSPGSNETVSIVLSSVFSVRLALRT